jgi:uncharacterized protein
MPNDIKQGEKLSLIQDIEAGGDAGFVEPHFGADNPLLEDAGDFREIIDREIKEHKDDILGSGSVSGSKFRIKVKVKGGYEPRFRHEPDEDEGGGQGQGEEGDGEGEGEEGEGQGSGSGGKGKGSSDVTYNAEYTWEQLADLIFEGVELPNLKPKSGGQTKITSIEINGIQPEGPDKLFDLNYTMVQYFERVLPYIRKDKAKYTFLDENGKVKIRWDVVAKTLPMADEDRRYNTVFENVEPDIRVVVSLILDRSASMNKKKMDMAKRFFRCALAYLAKMYGAIDVVIVRLAHDADPHPIENDEKFFSTDSGGTTNILPTYKYLIKLMEDEYPANSWNRFMWHASDGDIFDDKAEVKAVLLQMMRIFNFIGYCETKGPGDSFPWEDLGDIINSIPQGQRKGHIGREAVTEPNQVLRAFIDILKQGAK